MKPLPRDGLESRAMRALAVAWTLLVAGFLLADNPLPAEPLLDSAPIARGSGGLLEFLRKRALQKPDPEALKRLVQQLDSTNKADSDRAVSELIGYGPAAAQLLRGALKETGLNKAKPRVEECLKWIDGPDAGGLVCAVIRQVARSKPAGALAVLLSFAPNADDEAAAEDARQALLALAVRGGKIDADLEDAALKETNLPRRHTAIEIVCQTGLTDTIRKLLRDPSRDIRLRTANLRLGQADPEAMPVLIDLLGEPTSPEARSALDSLQRLAGPIASEPALGSPPKREAWAAWWNSVTGETLLKYFRERTPNVDLDKIGELIAHLGSKSFKLRQKAETDLVNLRGLSLPYLQGALKDADLEVRRRAERCLQNILSAPDAPLSAAQARLLALRRPPEAAATLLAFVAFADADEVTDEVRQSLRLLARHNRDAISVLKAGLAERTAQRRAIAAEVLAELAGQEQMPALRKLLGDLEPLVRLRTSLGLALRQERESVPVLIDLLGVLPQEQAWLAEDTLRRIAGDKAPAVVFDKDETARQNCRQAWDSWWKEHGEKTGLSGLQRRAAELGLTLVSLWDSVGNTNSIAEMGRDQKQRWKIGDLGYVFDFVLLPGNRLLMTENTRHKVTERNFKGEVLWSYEINSPINCQRLPNGHTFIVSQDRAVIVDRQKNVVLKADKHGGLMGGQRFRDGRILLVNGSGQCFILGPDGALLKQIQIMGGMSNYGGVQELANGRFLIAQHDRNKVSEYDQEGKLIWSADTPSPNFATRLSNGHTIVGSQDNRSMIELDREGKQLSKYEPGMSVWRVRRR